jgi:transposase
MIAGRSVPEIARSLSIGENIIYRWRKQALGSTVQTDAPVTASSQASLSEHLALQKRLREVEMERDIFKKALGIFSRPQ